MSTYLSFFPSFATVLSSPFPSFPSLTVSAFFPTLYTCLLALYHDTHLLVFPYVSTSLFPSLSLPTFSLLPSPLICPFLLHVFFSSFQRRFFALHFLPRVYSFPLLQAFPFPMASTLSATLFSLFTELFLSLYISLRCFSSPSSLYLLPSFTSILFTDRDHLFPLPSFYLPIVPRVLNGVCVSLCLFVLL